MRSGERVTAARPMSEPTSMWSGPIAMGGGVQRRRSVHHHGVGADAVDLRAQRDEEMREVLHVRLGGGVAQRRRAVRRDGRHQRVLGRRDARLVEEDVGALQSRGAEFAAARRR